MLQKIINFVNRDIVFMIAVAVMFGWTLATTLIYYTGHFAR